ncbi:MAG: Cu(I)-responsive transcriptional regulator [Casimicrobiaceae bacterium]
MNIGTVAQKSGVPPKTIRYYEMIGLIAPADRRPNGYRAYSDVDMRTLNFIKRARNLGVSVEEVRELLDLWRNKHTSAEVKALAITHLKVLDRKIAELAALRRTLADLITRCRGDGRPDCPILDELNDRADIRQEVGLCSQRQRRLQRQRDEP